MDSDLITIIDSFYNILLETKLPVVYLADFTNTFVPDKFHKWTLAEGIKYEKNVTKRAFFGIEGFKKIQLEKYNQVIHGETTYFDLKQEALDWLVE